MKGHLNSGKTYSLKQIFVNDTNEKVVIPDLQRDYCWGGKGTLVIDFVNNIKKRFEDCRENNKDWKDECLTCINTECRIKAAHSLMMGLLYGYYEDNRPNLQLCDGQQRLTTLYLLIGLINRLCGDNSFRHFLISDFELEEDDKEPNLLYDIRDSSLYFLSDLVCRCFIQEGRGNPSIETFSSYIRKQKWWFKVYETDPTIQSMLVAMDEMQGLLQGMDKPVLKDFGNYVCDMLQFVYFDMGDRKNGEKTFVIINTTGEPLTTTENLKPLVVTQGGGDSLSETEWEQNSQLWEEVDRWFWLHRDKSEEDTSDAGMKEFLRWVVALHPKEPMKKEEYYQWFTTKDYVFPYRNIGIQEIKETFDKLKLLNEDDEFINECEGLLAAPTGEMYDLKEYFVLLPTLKHFMKFKDKKAAVRIFRFFRNLSRYTEISKENNNVLLALRTIDCMKDRDVCSLLELESQINATYILTEEEKVRLTIFSKATDEEWRREVEDVFEYISIHQILSGRIRCLITCSCDNAHTFDFLRFKTNVQRFEALFPRERMNENVADDKTVLSFAAFCYERQPNAYPMANDNYRNFGYYAGEWNLFIYGDKNHEEHIQLFGDFLHEIDDQDVEVSQDRIINRLSADNPMYHLITKNMPCVLKNGEWRKRLSIHPASGLIRLFQNTSYRSDKDTYLIGQEVLLCRESEQWGQWYFYLANVGGKEEYCLYTDHKIYDVAIDLLFTKISDNQYRLRIFKRNNSKKDLAGLEDLLKESSFSVQEHDGRMVSEPTMPAEEIIKFIEGMKAKIQKLINDNDEN